MTTDEQREVGNAMVLAFTLLFVLVAAWMVAKAMQGPVQSPPEVLVETPTEPLYDTEITQ